MTFIADNYKKRTTSRDLIFVLILAISFVVTTLGTVYYLYSTANYQRELNERADYITDILAEVLALPLWNLDLNTIYRISDSYMENEYLVGVRISSDYEFLVEHRPSVPNNLLYKKKKIFRGETYVGGVELWFAVETVKQAQKRMISWIMIINLSVICVISLGTHLIMRSLLNRPLDSLIKNIRNIASGNYQTSLVFVPQHDINAIICEVNAMTGEIAKREAELRNLNKYLELRIAKQNEAEEELRKTQYYIKNVIDSMPSVIIGVDKDGRITHWNMAAEATAETGVRDIRDRPISEVYPHLASQMGNIRQSLANREPLKMEKQIRHGSDEIVYEDIMIYPLIRNGIDGAVIRVDDVTDRVRIEEMMIQTEKMMSVGGLAAGMAHEINNPLGIILQGTQNAFRRLSPEFKVNSSVAKECGTDLQAVRAYLEKRGILNYLNGIKDAGSRASKIVSNMLNFSRRSDSSVMVSSDINMLMDNTVELAASDYDLKKKYDFRHIEIIRDYDPELSQVICTPTEIEQVILNLLKNSAQAMENTEYPKITLQTQQEAEYVRINIRDNGPGMDRKTCKRIFEPFYTTKCIGVGTGLGLSVSYFIITNNHRGTMSAESEPGKGANFTIRLPSGGEKR